MNSLGFLPNALPCLHSADLTLNSIHVGPPAMCDPTKYFLGNWLTNVNVVS